MTALIAAIISTFLSIAVIAQLWSPANSERSVSVVPRVVALLIGAPLASTLVSGGTLWLAYECYNPWYQPGGERFTSQRVVFDNAVGNVLEHAGYNALILASAAYWVASQKNIGRLRLVVVIGVILAIAVAGLFYSIVDVGNSPTHVPFSHDRTYALAISQRIYVPGFLYPVAGFGNIALSHVIFAILVWKTAPNRGT